MNSPLPPPHVPYVRALEAYIDAKDNTRPQRMADAFASDAELTISLATSTITFPARTGGIDAITKTLVTDFGATYTRCRTYYVCDSLRARDGAIDPLPWLVLMREPAAGALRVGHGVYRWTFDDTGSVSRFHIHIARMDVVPDADGTLLEALQEGLSYPWLAPAELQARFVEHVRSLPELAFAEAFSRPADAPV
ncbi:hypothetical protein [Paraburkholderia phenoliruptrix]|uniref:SnoaL-like domain-containing protein n=2 Tax=Paraburkholderia phenoliruptrix TaxID=252970 RepID=A0A6J5KAM8_9BURK|nr:hypothetical protein [Paraburkholderia phenoliruptrix]AFT87551.1 hypothetical protein BUPH_03819 [Paraburkholderia phenoliruptrix BR3459a]MDR6387601.1 hypothetical protein [Paraburkholderia phenoliruptrix]CAB4051010.1 hypothetical protein LMG9964_04677 [Paraburkholderia phenoliruptrix]